MYFEKTTINDILNCQDCLGRLEGPKLLPCGETICSFCESLIKIRNLNKFECLICKKEHEMPKNGLPENNIVLKMLSIKPIKVYRGESVELLEKSLKDILKKQILIKHTIENTKDIITDHCIELRSSVQLKTEEAIQNINEMSSKIIEDIDKHENELILSNELNLKTIYEYEEVAKELEAFYTINSEYLKNPIIDHQIIKKSNEEAIILTNKANIEIENLNDLIFKGLKTYELINYDFF
jgi:hypothetical protein